MNGVASTMPSKEERIALCSDWSFKVNRSWGLPNFKEEHHLHANENLLTLEGFTSVHGVRNYLNLPFGRVAGRFLPMQRVDLASLRGVLDAKTYGPRFPQAPNVSKWITAHDYEMLGCTQRMSEYDSLTLNVYAPPEDLIAKAGGACPVFVHIHGGGFVYGDGLVEKDGNHLVQRSIELGQPIVVVTMNYRLNLFGFLTSKEIVAEQKAAGYSPVMNLGLDDQRASLEWIQRHVALFGGDPSQVTLSGESAGGASIWHQIKAKTDKPLFRRAIIRSFPPGGLRTFQESQQEFDEVVAKLGIAADAPDFVKMNALKSVPASEIVKLWNGRAMSAIYDPHWHVPVVRDGEATFSGSSGDRLDTDWWCDTPEWLEEVSIGACRDENSLFGCESWRGYTWEQADAVLQKVYPAELWSEIMKTRCYQEASSPFERLHAISSEGAWIAPSIEAAEKLGRMGRCKTTFFLSETQQVAPGPLHGLAPHGLDIVYLLYQPPARQHPEPAATADAMTRAFVAFTNGRGAWEEVDRSGLYMAFDGTNTGLRKLHGDRRDREIVVADRTLRDAFYRLSFRVVGELMLDRQRSIRKV